MYRLLIVLPALALCCGCIDKSGSVGSSARQTPPPEPGKYTCYRAVDKIVLDGKLREKSWKKAPGTGNFMMYDGKQQSPLSTTAKLVWDDQALYVAFECEDPDIYATFEQRDEALYNQDVVEVFIMRQNNTEGHYVEYEVSPRGTVFDQYLTTPDTAKLEWTSEALGVGAVVAGTLNKPADGDKGYTIEIRIPFADIYGAEGVSPEDGTEIRVNLYRMDYSTPEEIGKAGADRTFITWSPTGEAKFHQPDKFGVITFRRSPVGE